MRIRAQNKGKKFVQIMFEINMYRTEDMYILKYMMVKKNTVEGERRKVGEGDWMRRKGR